MKQDFLIELVQDPNTSLAHHGILGQKWGVRRYQNPDGSLTDAGKKRYTNDITKLNKLQVRAANYHNAAVTSTGLAKTIMAAKADKYTKKASQEVAKIATKWEDYIKRRKQEEKANDDRDKVSDVFKKSGWKVDDSGDFGSDIYAEKSSKLGPDKIKVYTIVDPGDKAGYINDHVKTLDSKLTKMESNSDTIYKQVSKFITDDLYNDNIDDVKNKMSASEYRKALKATGAYVTDWDTLDIDFSHPEHGSQILSVEYDLDNLKPIIERGVRMDD